MFPRMNLPGVVYISLCVNGLMCIYVASYVSVCLPLGGNGSVCPCV